MTSSKESVQQRELSVHNLTADTLHTRIQNNGRLALDTRQYSADALRSVFTQMATASLQGTYFDRSRRAVWYLPIALDEHATVQTATGAGINAFSRHLSTLASKHEPWAQQAQDSHKATERSRLAPESSVDDSTALYELYQQLAGFSAAQHPVLTIRTLLEHTGNPGNNHDRTTPCVVPIFYSTYIFPQNYAQQLGKHEIDRFRSVERVASAVMNIGHFMESTYGKQKPARFILAADLSPLDYLQQQPEIRSEEWIGHTANGEILYQFKNMM